MNNLDTHTSTQIADRLKSLFDSARRYQKRRSRPLVRSIHPRAFPNERQLELDLLLES
ncbi:MAG: hypothetical protein ACI8T1_003463 [Verrucomicrobiales bacterium]|jgi:hypothetical protein